MIKASLQHYEGGMLDTTGDHRQSHLYSPRIEFLYKSVRGASNQSLPVRFLFRRPLRPIGSVILVVDVCCTINDHSGQGNSGATRRCQGGHRYNIVYVGGAVARVLVPVRVDVNDGRGTGRIPFGGGSYVGHHTGRTWTQTDR